MKKQKTNKKISKKLLTFIIPLFLMGVVAAAYIVSSFVITTDVMEPFSVEYLIIGSGGNWVEGDPICSALDDNDSDWAIMDDVDVGGLYAGEGRLVCAKIVNAGEGEVSYIFKAEVQPGFGNYEKCLAAFDSPSVSGTVGDKATVKRGFKVLVNDGAEPVENCEITLSVSRG